MIKANELRIGSLISIGNKTMHVTSISLDIDDEYEESIGYCEVGKTINEEIATLCSLKAEPIPLTHEWLKRAGMVDQNIFFPGEPIITSKGSVLIQCLNDASITFYLPIYATVEIKYLHQLQNLVYALTGEELQIKIP